MGANGRQETALEKPDIVAFGRLDSWLSGSRPQAIGLWRWVAFQDGPDRYTHWVMRAYAGDLPGAFRDAKGKWMVAIDWALIDEIGLYPAIRRAGWVTVPGQAPGQAPPAAAGSG